MPGVVVPGMVVPGAAESAEADDDDDDEEAAGAAVTLIAADACGSLDTCAALATAVRLTDVTVLADAATATFACSCRWAELASSAPRSHDALPSWLPQPKLNAGLRLEGAATRLRLASGTLPPSVQAVTVHSAACPRWMLDCAGCTATQRLTCPGCAVVLVKATGLPDAGPLFVADGLDVRDGVDFADVLVVAFCVAVGFGEAVDVVDVLVAVGVGDLVAVDALVAVGVGVGDFVADADVVGVAVAFAEGLPVVVDVALGFWDGLDVLVGDAVGVCDLLADGELVDDFRISVVVLAGDVAAELLAEELDVGVGE